MALNQRTIIGREEAMGDIIERAEEVLKWTRTGATYRSLGKLVPELVAEVKRLRSYKSIPAGMVWQDYYSPDDVIRLREPLDAEIERLRGLVDDVVGVAVERGKRLDAFDTLT